jgi:hypothetical protein
MLIRFFLALIALMFAVFGAITMLDPIAMAASLGVEVGGPNGAYELRGIYGGVSFGAAALAAGGAITERLRRPALWFLVAYMGGYIFARAAGLALGPAPTADFYAFVGFEAVCLILAVLCLRALRAS